MEVYPKEYLWCTANEQGIFFDSLLDVTPEIDISEFIKVFMKSEYRRTMDEGIPRYLTRFGPEIMEEYRHFQKELGLSVDLPPMMPESIDLSQSWTAGWIGNIYCLLQWITHIPSCDLVDLVTVEELAQLYHSLHDLDYSLAIGYIVRYHGLSCPVEDEEVCNEAGYFS